MQLSAIPALEVVMHRTVWCMVLLIAVLAMRHRRALAFVCRRCAVADTKGG